MATYPTLSCNRSLGHRLLNKADLWKIARAFFDDLSFLPLTVVIDIGDEDAVSKFNDQSTRSDNHWIMKPASESQGRGIQMLPPAVVLSLEDCQSNVIQEYVDKPLLIDGRKIDFRSYLHMVQHGDGPWSFLWHPGIARLCSRPYDLSSLALEGHLCNTSINSQLLPEDECTIAFQEAMDRLGLSAVAFRTKMEILMKKVASLAVHASDARVHGNTLCHNTLYVDILATDDGHALLLEINSGGQNLNHIHHNGLRETVSTGDLHKFHHAVLWKGLPPDEAATVLLDWHFFTS